MAERIAFKWKCKLCDEVSPLTAASLTKKIDGKYTVTFFNCPACGQKSVVQVDNDYTISLNKYYTERVVNQDATKQELHECYTKLSGTRQQLLVEYTGQPQPAQANSGINTSELEK